MQVDLVKPTIEKIYCASTEGELLELSASEIRALSVYLRMMDIVLEDLVKRWNDEERKYDRLCEFNFSANGDPL